MSQLAVRYAGSVVSFLVCAGTGFFLVGPAVFADGAMSSRLGLLGLAALLHLVCAWAVVALTGSGWAWVWLSGPAVLTALVLGEFGLISIGATVAVVGAAFGGNRLGAWWRTRSNP